MSLNRLLKPHPTPAIPFGQRPSKHVTVGLGAGSHHTKLDPELSPQTEPTGQANTPAHGILYELDRTIIAWCVSASFINAMVLAPEHADELIPNAQFWAKPHIYTTFKSLDPELVAAIPASDTIGQFYQLLEHVHQQHAACLTGVTHVDDVALRTMQATAHRVSSAAVRVIIDLEVLQVRLVHDGVVADFGKLRDLLNDVAAGQTPCNDGATVVYPDWTKGRKSARLWLGAEAYLRYSTGWNRIMIDDISEGGVGIRANLPLGIDDFVTLEFDNGRKMTGTVVNKSGDRFGIKFDHRLPSTDPLISH
jgi:hypothetical protein